MEPAQSSRKAPALSIVSGELWVSRPFTAMLSGFAPRPMPTVQHLIVSREVADIVNFVSEVHAEG